MLEFFIVLSVLTVAVIMAVFTVQRLIHICAPNEVLIFSGKQHKVGRRTLGYRVVKGGRGLRVPLFEKVDRLDLTNMIIEVNARNAYSRGGVPLNVNGVANVKIAGHEPVLDNAIERLLGKPRGEVMQIAKATLEGALRGVLATLTPEQVNEDRILFAERLVAEVERDMTALGLVVDTLKIQNVQDDVRYLDSIGRIKTAEIQRKARIAEARERAEAVVQAAKNREAEARAKISAEIDVAKATADKALTDALTRRDAVVAEAQAKVVAQVAQAKADVGVQTARVEQVRRQLDADVIQPAKAWKATAEAKAKADAAPIVQDGKARAAAFSRLADSWRRAGPSARQVLMLQKLDGVIQTITDLVGETNIEQVTMIDSKAPTLSDDASLPLKAMSSLEQVKQLFGVDILDRLGGSRKQLSAPRAPVMQPQNGRS